MAERERIHGFDRVAVLVDHTAPVDEADRSESMNRNRDFRRCQHYKRRALKRALEKCEQIGIWLLTGEKRQKGEPQKDLQASRLTRIVDESCRQGFNTASEWADERFPQLFIELDKLLGSPAARNLNPATIRKARRKASAAARLTKRTE